MPLAIATGVCAVESRRLRTASGDGRGRERKAAEYHQLADAAVSRDVRQAYIQLAMTWEDQAFTLKDARKRTPPKRGLEVSVIASVDEAGDGRTDPYC